eukprot:2055973-Karenia_brevis.AAC.1
MAETSSGARIRSSVQAPWHTDYNGTGVFISVGIMGSGQPKGAGPSYWDKGAQQKKRKAPRMLAMAVDDRLLPYMRNQQCPCPDNIPVPVVQVDY